MNTLSVVRKVQAWPWVGLYGVIVAMLGQFVVTYATSGIVWAAAAIPTPSLTAAPVNPVASDNSDLGPLEGQINEPIVNEDGSGSASANIEQTAKTESLGGSTATSAPSGPTAQMTPAPSTPSSNGASSSVVPTTASSTVTPGATTTPKAPGSPTKPVAQPVPPPSITTSTVNPAKLAVNSKSPTATSGPVLKDIYDPLARFLAAKGTGTSGYEIIINLPSFRLFLYQKGTLLSSFPIAVGKVVSPSNLGTARIVNKVANPTYYPPDWAQKGLKPIPPGPDNPVGTLWMGLSMKGYGIHGTNVPSSIGKAMSGGCIRMLNNDVEALAKIIPVNTPVTFLYELVAAWRDAVSNWPFLEVFPDIYRQGAPTFSSTLHRLHTAGITEPVHQDALRYIIAKAGARPEPVPLDSPLEVVGLGPVSGYLAAGRRYVSVKGLAQILGEISAVGNGDSVSVYGRNLPEAWSWSGVVYAPLTAAADAFGLLKTDSDQLLVPKLMYNAQEISSRVFAVAGGAMLPLEPLARLLGFPLTWDRQAAAPVLNGELVANARVMANRSYLSQTDVKRIFGVEVRWDNNAGTAEIVRPGIVYAEKRTEGYWRNNEVWLPVRFVAETLGIPMEWDALKHVAYVGNQEVQGQLLGGKLYAAQTDILVRFPQVNTFWDEDTQSLELMIAPTAANSF